jgi:hypothetical protein
MSDYVNHYLTVLRIQKFLPLQHKGTDAQQIPELWGDNVRDEGFLKTVEPTLAFPHFSSRQSFHEFLSMFVQ